MNHFKICCESGCNWIYQPDASGRCPRCGSAGLWINNTVLGTSGDHNPFLFKEDMGAKEIKAWFKGWDRYFNRRAEAEYDQA